MGNLGCFMRDCVNNPAFPPANDDGLSHFARSGCHKWAKPGGNVDGVGDSGGQVGENRQKWAHFIEDGYAIFGPDFCHTFVTNGQGAQPHIGWMNKTNRACDTDLKSNRVRNSLLLRKKA